MTPHAREMKRRRKLIRRARDQAVDEVLFADARFTTCGATHNIPDARRYLSRLEAEVAIEQDTGTPAWWTTHAGRWKWFAADKAEKLKARAARKTGRTPENNPYNATGYFADVLVRDHVLPALRQNPLLTIADLVAADRAADLRRPRHHRSQLTDEARAEQYREALRAAGARRGVQLTPDDQVAFLIDEATARALRA